MSELPTSLPPPHPRRFATPPIRVPLREGHSAADEFPGEVR